MGWGDFLQKLKKVGAYLCFTIVFAIGFHIIVSGLELTFEKKEQSIRFEAPEPLQNLLSDALLHTFLPALAYEEDSQILPEVLPSLLFEKYNLARFVEMEGDNFDAAFEIVAFGQRNEIIKMNREKLQSAGFDKKISFRNVK